MFLFKWVFNALGLMAAGAIVNGIHVGGFGVALVAVVGIWLVGCVVKPVVGLLTLPLTVLTLGLFWFVVNALSFWAALSILPGMSADGFVPALLGSIFYGAVGWLSGTLFDASDKGKGKDKAGEAA